MSSSLPQPGAFYSVGYSDPRAIYTSTWTFGRPYGQIFKHKRKWASPLMPHKKVDAHKYKTEARTLPIEACQSMWLIRYGDGAVDASVLVEQDDLIWEIGNRLFWAGLLEHDTQTDRYTCKS